MPVNRAVSPLEVFLLQFKIAALLDVVVCSPSIAWNIWQFVLPALYERFVAACFWSVELGESCHLAFACVRMHVPVPVGDLCPDSCGNCRL